MAIIKTVLLSAPALAGVRFLQQNPTCSVGDRVLCPGSTDNYCGESQGQCCERNALSGYKTFVCPSAPATFNNCEMKQKLEGTDCLAPAPTPPTTCAVDDNVKCADGVTTCSGNQCCPAFGNYTETYPCPSAGASGWNSTNTCQSEIKITDCLSESTTAVATPKPRLDERVVSVLRALTRKPTCSYGESVMCPGSTDNTCAGDQCCNGNALSKGKSFVCPSASATFNNCEIKQKLEGTDCLTCAAGARVQCANGDYCAGNECCPQIDGKTYPCPSASNYEGVCESDIKIIDCLADA